MNRQRMHPAYKLTVTHLLFLALMLLLVFAIRDHPLVVVLLGGIVTISTVVVTIKLLRIGNNCEPTEPFTYSTRDGAIVTEHPFPEQVLKTTASDILLNPPKFPNLKKP